MSTATNQGQSAYDPFGEPMELPAVCTDAKGYGETRRVAITFWVLALIFLAGRVYLSDPTSEPTFAQAAPAGQVAALR